MIGESEGLGLSGGQETGTKTSEIENLKDTLRGLEAQFGKGELTREQIIKITADLVENMLENANIDKLTNLMRREAFQKKMVEIIGEAQRNPRDLVIIFGDLNGLHETNNYSYVLGDHLLMGVGQAINDRKRESDLASRWGGDEFVILCNYVNPDAIEVLVSSYQETIDSRLGEIARMFNMPEDDAKKIGISLGHATITKEEIAKLPRDLTASERQEFISEYILRAEKIMKVNKKLKKAERSS